MSEVKVLDNGNVLVTVPISLRFRSGRKRVIFSENDSVAVDPLVMNLARAFRWQELIDSGVYRNAGELATVTGKDPSYVARILRLTLLSPEIVHAALTVTLERSIPPGDTQERAAATLGRAEEIVRDRVRQTARTARSTGLDKDI